MVRVRLITARRVCGVMVRVLGPLEVEGPDGAVSVGGPVPRRLLCALLVTPGAVVSVDALIDAAWGKSLRPARNARWSAISLGSVKRS